MLLFVRTCYVGVIFFLITLTDFVKLHGLLTGFYNLIAEKTEQRQRVGRNN